MLSVADSHVACVVAAFNCQHNLESHGKSLSKGCLGRLVCGHASGRLSLSHQLMREDPT